MITVYPAIDLRGGRCVRLVQGDPAREHVFSDDPVATARRWVAEGARALHVVDLDGALGGRAAQTHLLEAIAAAVPVPVQWGGGLRTEADVEAALARGAARVVIGTRALEEAFLRRVLERWGPERIVAGLDVRGEAVAVEGWQAAAGVSLGEAAARLRAWGAREVVHTQVRRDGMLAGPDLDGVRRVTAGGLRAVASGGVAAPADVAALAAIPGVAGAIVGRALYAGRLRLADALAAAGGAGRAAPNGPGGAAPGLPPGTSAGDARPRGR